MTKTIIDFWAEWCKPCKDLKPELDRLETLVDENGEKRFEIIRYDVEDGERGTAAAWGANVNGLPTLFLKDGGRVIERVSGSTCAAKLREWEQREAQNEVRQMRGMVEGWEA